MALYHKWDVKNGFPYVLQFFSLISDGLGGVCCLRNYVAPFTRWVIFAALLSWPVISANGCFLRGNFCGVFFKWNSHHAVGDFCAATSVACYFCERCDVWSMFAVLFLCHVISVKVALLGGWYSFYNNFDLENHFWVQINWVSGEELIFWKCDFCMATCTSCHFGKSFVVGWVILFL